MLLSDLAAGSKDRHLSEKSSAINSSFRVYYGGAAGSVPFLWESQPGTPKHSSAAAAAAAASLPPLSPPPSYFCATYAAVKTPPKPTVPGFIQAVLPKLRRLRKVDAWETPSSSISSYSSSRSSSSSRSGNSRRLLSSLLSCAGAGEGEDDYDDWSPTSTLVGYGSGVGAAR